MHCLKRIYGCLGLARQIAVAGLLGLAGAAVVHASERQPNVIFILADDLGYGDLGCYGQAKIRTPHLDRLAAGGMRLTQHYAGSPVCAPSRCVLMTGQHPGHAWIRDNREMRPEGQFPLPESVTTLSKALRGLGYHTGAFGKWGLGGPGSSGEPSRQGFERFFGYNCQRLAHNYYPTSLWDNAKVFPLGNHAFVPHQKLAPEVDPLDSRAYRQFRGSEYAPDRIADAALRFIREYRQRPFFLFYPSTIPHLALQVPEDALAEYEGQFPEAPYVGDRYYLPHRAPRAAYAAMVSRLDRDVGRLLDLVRELGLEEQTIVVFTSDNGPLYDRLGGTDTEFFQSASSFRGRKGSVYEGGLRVPCIVRWPGHVPAGGVSDLVTGFEDWLPTLLELVSGTVSFPTDGTSFAPTLTGKHQSERAFLYREFPAYGGQQCIRVGRWKAVRQNLNSSKSLSDIKTELYDLVDDPRESADVSRQNPAVLQMLERLMQAQHRPSAEFPFPILDAEVTESTR